MLAAVRRAHLYRSRRWLDLARVSLLGFRRPSYGCIGTAVVNMAVALHRCCQAVSALSPRPVKQHSTGRRFPNFTAIIQTRQQCVEVQSYRWTICDVRNSGAMPCPRVAIDYVKGSHHGVASPNNNRPPCRRDGRVVPSVTPFVLIHVV